MSTSVIIVQRYVCFLARVREITSDLAGVVCQPSRMASSCIRIEVRGRIWSVSLSCEVVYHVR
jgi:hypothetical protein